jgi:hypothetical protein
MTRLNDDEQMNMFGCLLVDLDDDIKGISRHKYYSLKGFTTSVLSDVQHQIATEQYEKARQYINIAKYIIKQMKGK